MLFYILDYAPPNELRRIVNGLQQTKIRLKVNLLYGRNYIYDLYVRRLDF
jgi:hypothetical protein